MYIIVFNPNSRDAHLALDTRYFVETYSTYEDARRDAEDALDGEQYRNYQIFEQVNN